LNAERISLQRTLLIVDGGAYHAGAWAPHRERGQ
jgi:hypothetical protein